MLYKLRISLLPGSAPAKERKIAQLKRQLSLEESFERKKLWGINDDRAKQIHKKIMIMMALNNQLFQHGRR